MKQLLYIIIAFLTFFSSCKQIEKDRIISETSTKSKKDAFQEQKIEIIREDTLFLNLSPNMTEVEFNNAKFKENGKRLIDGKFQILLGDEILDFSVYQNNKAIELNYSKYFSKNELNKNSHKVLFNKLFRVINDKYDYNKTADFLNFVNYDGFTKTYYYDNPKDSKTNTQLKHLKEFGFDNTNYVIFNDSLKTIVVGFSTRKNKMIELFNESQISNGFKDGNNQSNIKIEKINVEELKMFDFSITIDYFLKKDFESIKNLINKDFQNYKTIKINDNKNKEEKLKKIENNKSEF